MEEGTITKVEIEGFGVISSKLFEAVVDKTSGILGCADGCRHIGGTICAQ
jgi:hypothetical protein